MPFKYCLMNVLINLVEFQHKTEVISIRRLRMRIISSIINLVPMYVLTFQGNIPYIVACFLLVRFYLLHVHISWDYVDILWYPCKQGFSKARIS